MLELRPWRVKTSERKMLVEALFELTDASDRLPVKRERNADEQDAVETWTEAVVRARAVLRLLANRYYS